MKAYKIIRYIEFNYLFELFFVSSIVTILVIRLYLILTGFPQIAFGSFHIAHMLWGGLMLVLSLFGFMTFLNDDFKPIWSVLGGVGFGFFIDELGKYITKDNNYHYQPTFAIIYIIFICLYVLYKNITPKKDFSSDEYIINAAEKLKEIIIHDLDKEEQAKALEYLKLSKRNDAIEKFLKASFTDIDHIPAGKNGWYTKGKNYLAGHYRYFISRPWFATAVIILFIIRSLSDLFIGNVIIATFMHRLMDGSLTNSLATKNTILLIIQFTSLNVQALFTIIGVSMMRKSRKGAYRYFRNALFISIFILEVYSYYHNPFLALISTIADLLLLSILNYIIIEEEQL